MMNQSDYIGIAVTSPDFPVKQQLYPHYNFSESERVSENRRYVLLEDIVDKKPDPIFNDQNINRQVKDKRGERILFLKYFGKGEDLNYINYENDNINSSQTIDLINQMLLKKFTLRLFLIDRYNNFEPITLYNANFDDVVKMQILFRRIKGSEKENRMILENDFKENERVFVDLEEEPKAEPIIQPIIEVQKETNEETPEEEEIELPPEKRIYLDEETEQSENEIENELY